MSAGESSIVADVHKPPPPPPAPVLSQNPSSLSKVYSMKVVEDALRNFRTYRVYHDNTARINHMDYSHDGKLLITSSDDDSMVVYSCDRGTKLQTVNSKKYGVCLIQFANDNKSVVHASSKVDNTIRYLSIDNKQYLRYFSGHVKRVRSLSMSPVDECFLSCSFDNSMRLWDLRVQSCQAIVMQNSPGIASFDRNGMVFAVALGSKVVKMYDIRHFDRGPFMTINLPPECHAEASNMQFSANNKLAVLGTRSDDLYVVDTYEAKFLHRLHGHKNETHVNLKPTFAPGSRHVLCGGTDGIISVYSLNKGEIVQRLRTEHSTPIETVLFSRRYLMMYSSCTELRVWLPGTPDDSHSNQRH
ncbi:WD repeat-containing protein 82 [Aphelenchoides fujianensis]|nr:WD repeat-containing protein 82 [Aphelenchoides fujianensis]